MLVALLLAASLPDLVPAHWFSADPKSLDLLKDTPVNCLLLDEPQWSEPFLSAAAKREITTLAVLRPGPSAMDSAQKVASLKFTGAVLEGSFDAADARRIIAFLNDSNIRSVRLGLRSDIRLDNPGEVAGTFQGVWPGIEESGDEIKAAPSGGPWIDTNSGFLRFVRAATTAPVWIANAPPAGKSWPVQRYIQAIGDAAMTGSRWVLTLDPAFQKKLLASDAAALKDWSRIAQTLAFYEAHKEWRSAHAAGHLALIEDVPSGALLSGGILDMIAVKHTPVRPVPTPKLDAKLMAGSKMAVNVDPESLTEAQKEILKGYTRAGGTLLTGPPGWKFPEPKPGQITLEKADLDKLDQIWKEMNAMTGRRNLGARLFNVASMLSNMVELPDGRLVLHLVNYSDYDVENITVHVLGRYTSATLYRPGAPPATVQGYEVEDGTGFDLEHMGGLGALVLTRP